MSKVLNNSPEFSGASIIRAITAGLCSSLVGIGLSRFAFSPLIPPLVNEHWFAASQAAYLGAANLMGYVIGALISLDLASAIPVRPLLRAMMLIVTASFFASGYPLPFLWFFAWRFAAGCAGGVLMVAGMSAALEQIPPKRRGLAAGIVIGGVGAGIIEVRWCRFCSPGDFRRPGLDWVSPHCRRLAPVAAAETRADPTKQTPDRSSFNARPQFADGLRGVRADGARARSSLYLCR